MSFLDTGSRSPEAPEGVLAWADASEPSLEYLVGSPRGCHPDLLLSSFSGLPFFEQLLGTLDVEVNR